MLTLNSNKRRQKDVTQKSTTEIICVISGA